MTTKPKKAPLSDLFAKPGRLVARLILAEAVSKRGEGPLERKRLVYIQRKR